MKKVNFLIATCIFSFNLIARNVIPNSDEKGDKYCTKMKDGKITVMHGGAEMTSDATLTNGSVIKTDGTVIKKDGTKMTLKSGECVGKDGKMEKAMPMKKNKMEK